MLSTAEKICLMQDLFVHPQSFFAEQVYEENKGVIFYPRRQGSCTHTPKHRPRDCPDVQEIVFTDRHMLDHLKGTHTYAPYQLKDGRVKWVCIDVDGYSTVGQKQLQEITTEIAAAIHTMVGPKTFIVEQSGSKGYHIWLFFDEPMNVERGYALGHWITSHVTPKPGINLEVYPKQTTSKLFGNTVKLPLGIHRKTGNRCWIVDSSFNKYEDQWEKLQSVRRVSSSWVEEHVPSIPMRERETNEIKDSRAPVCFTNILTNGSTEGVRDEAAFRLACYLRNNGVPEDLAESWLFEWNRKNDPPLDDEQLSLKVESAYGEEYHWLPCGSPSFDSYCSSTCYFFDKKVRLRWHNNKTDPRGKISYE